MNFTYSIVKQDLIHILNLEGELIESSQASNLVQDLDKLILNNQNRFIINLANLKYMNSSGLNILIQILTKSRKSGGEAIMTNVEPRIKNLLIITKLNTIFEISSSIENATEKMNKLIEN